MRNNTDERTIVHTHDFIAPEGGVDLPPSHGPFRPVGHLVDLPLARGATRATVTVSAEGLSAPLDRPPTVALFLDDDLQVEQALTSGTTLTLPWRDVEDTQLLTIKWRSARGVTNRLEENGRLRSIISMDIGTRRPARGETTDS